jgi:hypothetical protein
MEVAKLEVDEEGQFTALLNANEARRKDPSMDTKGLIVLFEVLGVPNEEKTAKAGRPIYDDVDSIKIYAPGDRHNVIHRQVLPMDKIKFAKEYVAWKRGSDMAPSGTPVEAVPWISKGQVEELKYFHVRTVEQLAALTDGNAQNMGPILRLRQTARDWLDAAEDNKLTMDLRAQIEERDGKVANLERLLKQQADAISELRKAAGIKESEGEGERVPFERPPHGETPREAQHEDPPAPVRIARKPGSKRK